MNPVRHFRRRVPRAAAVAAAVALIGVSGAVRAGPRGEALFGGAEPLQGTIRGHRSALPPEVLTCRNCHRTSEPKGSAPDPAPPLSRSLLRDKVQRRGGPPSSYDVASLCKLLRTGIDPAYILISRVMPVYDVTDAQCNELWEFLTAETRAKK